MHASIHLSKVMNIYLLFTVSNIQIARGSKSTSTSYPAVSATAISQLIHSHIVATCIYTECLNIWMLMIAIDSVDIIWLSTQV